MENNNEERVFLMKINLEEALSGGEIVFPLIKIKEAIKGKTALLESLDRLYWVIKKAIEDKIK